MTRPAARAASASGVGRSAIVAPASWAAVVIGRAASDTIPSSGPLTRAPIATSRAPRARAARSAGSETIATFAAPDSSAPSTSGGSVILTASAPRRNCPSACAAYSEA